MHAAETYKILLKLTYQALRRFYPCCNREERLELLQGDYSAGIPARSSNCTIKQVQAGPSLHNFQLF